MSTETLDKTDVESIADLDFEIVCELSWGLVMNGRVLATKECEEKAEWVGNLPCCGRAVVTCQQHKDNVADGWLCSGCKKTHPTLIGWRPLKNA